MMKTVSEHELEPCPFCGGEAIILAGFEEHVWIFCEECKAEISACATEAEAIEAWNKRTQPPSDPWIPCSERLPDESMDLDNNGIVTVLVTWEFDGMWFNGCSYCDVIDYDLAFNSFIISNKRKVVAWKPIEPYKRSEKNEDC